MIRPGGVCFLLAVVCLVVRADAPPGSAAVKKLAQDLGDWTRQGDYAKVIDHTYAALVKEMGGRDKAINAIEAVMQQMQDKGFILKAFEVGEPGEFLTEGSNTFVVLPTRFEMSFPGGKVVGKSYLLGISSDQGKTWTFADGAGIVKHKEIRARVLPKLPDKLKLPEVEKPEVIKDK